MPGLFAPPTVEAPAEPNGRFGVAFAPRFLLLLALGLVCLVPALFDLRFFYAAILWDFIALAAWGVDLLNLPAPRSLVARREWNKLAVLSVESSVELAIWNRSPSRVRVRVIDEVPSSLAEEPPTSTLDLAAHAESRFPYRINPRRRGRVAVGKAYLRYQSRLGFAERWARASIEQSAVVYPDIEEAQRQSVYLVRGRQIEIERRSRKIRSTGQLFESLREYQDGDDLRHICWTASARRGKLITRRYEAERRQTVWLVVDTGRLMRTRVNAITKLDYAVNAALAVAGVALQSGDRVGLAVYGHRLTQHVLPGSGGGHLRQLVDSLALVEAGEAEADHRYAAGRLLTEQKRRSLVIWITDIPDVAVTPDVVQAVTMLMPRHLVLFAVIGQPDVERVAWRRPGDVEQMYETAAAQEVLTRRRLLLAQLRAGGALALEAREKLTVSLVNTYLEVKDRGRL